MLTRLAKLFTVVKMVPQPLFPVVQPWRQFVTRTRKSDYKIEQGKQQRKEEEEQPRPEHEQEEEPKRERPTAKGEKQKEPGMRREREKQEIDPTGEIPPTPEKPTSRRQTKRKSKQKQ